MVPRMMWKVLMVCLLFAFSAAMAGCSNTRAELRELRAAKMLEEQLEQERLDRQRLAGLEGRAGAKPANSPACGK